MKFIRLALLPVFLFSGIGAATGQQHTRTGEGQNEISLSVGVITIPEIVTTLGDIFATSFTGQKVEESEGSGAITVAYSHFASPKFSYGLSATYERLTTTYSNPADKIKWNAFAFILNGRYHYVSRPSFRLYSGLGAGYATFNAKSNNSSFSNGAFAFQVNALGARFGRQIGVFAELGFGYEGVIKAGVAYRF